MDKEAYLVILTLVLLDIPFNFNISVYDLLSNCVAQYQNIKSILTFRGVVVIDLVDIHVRLKLLQRDGMVFKLDFALFFLFFGFVLVCTAIDLVVRQNHQDGRDILVILLLGLGSPNEELIDAARIGRI